jgi:hypothetical protein
MNDTLTTVCGGKDVEVKLGNGSSESVFVRQLPIKLMTQLLAALEDEPKMIELFCDRPAGWSDSLTPESFEALVSEGERINADFFGRWLQRRLKRQERLIPGITERLAQTVGLPSPIGSPKSPSEPG